jgi:hypothetical protein
VVDETGDMSFGSVKGLPDRATAQTTGKAVRSALASSWCGRKSAIGRCGRGRLFCPCSRRCCRAPYLFQPSIARRAQDCLSVRVKGHRDFPVGGHLISLWVDG